MKLKYRNIFRIVLPVLALVRAVSAAPPTGDFAVYATGTGCGAISMTGNAFTDSFDSSKGTYGQTVQAAKSTVGVTGNIAMSGNAVINGVVAAPNITVGSCTGKTPDGITISGHPKVTGGYIQLSPVPVFPAPASVLSGSQDYSVTSSLTLAPGSYGNVQVSGNATLKLAPGMYNLNSLSVSGNATLIISPTGPVIVNLTGNGGMQPLQFSGNGMAGSPENLWFNYAGTGQVQLTGNASIYAIVYAPNAAATFAGNAQLYGSAIVNTLNWSGNGAVHQDRSLIVAPVISWQIAPISNAAGWNNSAATVTFLCSDAIFGIASCTSPVKVSMDGANLLIPGTATSRSGATATTVATVNLDQTPPGVGITSPLSGATVSSAALSVAGTVSDSLSGVAGVTCNGSAAVVSNGTFTCGVTLAPGSNTVTAVATDIAGNTNTASIKVTLSGGANQAPMVSAGANQMNVSPAVATLNGTATDDGLPNPPGKLTIAWSQDSGPAPALIANPTQAATTAQFTVPGVYVLRLTASDSVLSSSATTQVTVTDSGPTLGVIPDRTIAFGTSFDARLIANDSNVEDTFTYYMDVAPTGAVFNPAPLIQWTPTSAQIGSNAFTVRVVDSESKADSKTFHVTVTPANLPPQLAPQADQRVPAGGAFIRTLSATDADGDALTFSLVFGPPGLTLTGGNQLMWSPVASAPGVYTVQAKVTDVGGLFDVGQFRITVFAAALPVTQNDAYQVMLGQTLMVPAPGVLGNDVDPDGGTLVAADLTNPDKGTLSTFNPAGSFTYIAPSTPPGPVLDVQEVSTWNGGAGVEIGLGPLLAADVNGDGKPEILSFEYNGDLYVVRTGSTPTTLFHVGTLTPGEIGGQNCAIYGVGNQTMAVGDINDDGQVEIVMPAQCAGDAGTFFAGGAANRVVALSYDPTRPDLYHVKWLTPILPANQAADFTAQASFTIARLRSTETPSVLIGHTYQGAGQCAQVIATSTDTFCRVVFALNGTDGSIRTIYYSAPADPASAGGYNNGIASGGYMAPVVADVDNSGNLSILYEGTLWNLDGTVRIQLDGTASTGPATSSSAVVDLDGDPQMEIVTLDNYGGFGEGTLKAWKVSGQLLWSIPVPRSYVTTRLSVADVDRDGLADILVTWGPVLMVVDNTGNVKWLRNFQTATDGFSFQFFNMSHFPVYDLNGDGIPEVIVQYGKNTLLFLRGDTGVTETSWQYPGTTWNSAQSPYAPLVADIDGSGQASVVYQHDVNGDGTSFLQILKGNTLAWQPAPTHFNQQAYWETNFNADGSIPTTYTRQTTDPRTNVFYQQPQKPYSPTFEPAAQTSFTYDATNDAGPSGPTTVAITLEPATRPPQFTSHPPKFWIGTSFVYYSHAVDPNLGATLTYALVYSDPQGGGNVLVNPVTGELDVNYLGTNPGTVENVMISATDNFGAISYQTFTVAYTANTSVVPSLIGTTQAAASASLTAAQLSLGSVTQVFNPAAAGTVVGQTPGSGTILPQGENVYLTVSQGPTPVVVPDVVGQAGSAATTLLTGQGFTVVPTTMFSNTVAAGIVMGQAPSAGTAIQPTQGNPVTLLVSAGTGLTLTLSQSVAAADQTITVTPAAFDSSGNPVALPALTYSITPSLSSYLGTLPALSGLTISSGSNTLGAFTITAIDSVNSRSATANFAVLPPTVPGAVTNGESFASMLSALDSIYALQPQLQAARTANNVPLMTSLLQQIVTTWRTVDLDDLRISQPVVTPTQFAPTIDMMAGFGYSPTADDILSNQYLNDAIADLTAWTTALQSPGTTQAQIYAAADQFATRAARLDGLTISPYGGINNVPQYTRLMTQAIPAFFEALTGQFAALTGVPADTPAFPDAMLEPASRAGAKGPGSVREHSPRPDDLAEETVTLAVNLMVDKVMDYASQVYNNAKQVAVAVMQQGAWTAAVVTAASQFRAAVQGQVIPQVVAGASLSFFEFQSAPSWIEVPGDPDPANDEVFMIGPDLFTQILGAGTNFVQSLQNGYSTGQSALSNPNRYTNMNQVKSDVSKLVKSIKSIGKSFTNLSDVITSESKLAMQSPDQTLYGCIFDGDPACRQLVYSNGFQPVYNYGPPAGFKTIGGLPVAILYIVFNKTTGIMYFGTPEFLPCTLNDPMNPTQTTCPNNPPTNFP